MSDLPLGSTGSAISAVSWPAIFAGAAVALAVSLICVALGAGFSAGSLAAWPDLGHGITTFTAMTGVWIIITQWIASGIGGYITGRLRTRWHELHTHEVFFRDTANGLITWAVVTCVVAALGAMVALGGHDSAMAAARTSPDALEAAKKAAAGFAIFNAIAMLIGAFVACVASALGGQQRDAHP